MSMAQADQSRHFNQSEANSIVGRLKSVPQATDPPLLTVIVPVYNEASTVDRVLQRILAAPYSKEVIVVDDGSTDGTLEALEKWEGVSHVRLLQHSRNRGKGAAIRTALEHARGRFTVIQDADLEYDPADYGRLIEPLLAGQADVVYGSRYAGREKGTGPICAQHPAGRSGKLDLSPFPSGRRNWLRFGVYLLNWCVRLLYGVRLTDEATCYKAFPTAALRAMALECQRFEFCPEVTAKACRLGLKIMEVPIHYDARRVRAGKKLRWTDGVQALRTLWKWRSWKGELPRQTGCSVDGIS